MYVYVCIYIYIMYIYIYIIYIYIQKKAKQKECWYSTKLTKCLLHYRSFISVKKYSMNKMIKYSNNLQYCIGTKE